MLALAALLRAVSLHVLALSSALWISGVLGDGALRRSFNPANVVPSCLGWGRGVLFDSTSTQVRPSALVLVLLGALLVLLRPVVPYTLALLRSALGRFLGRWYLAYQCSSWRC